MMINTILGVSLEFGDGAGANALAILYILCGLGIFLFGINMMGTSLKAIAGDKMKVIIEKSTNTPFKGMLVGFVTTMLTQSASGTSALAVSLVGAGLMSFGQAIGVLLGANIGGTVLTIILAAFSQLKIMPVVSVALVFIGATMIFFFKNKRLNQIGYVILGFGLIFLGLAFIDMSFGHFLGDEDIARGINNIFAELANIPFLGITVGTLFTIVVQSSSATIGIVQSMYTVGSISLFGALALKLGANIGTTITALLASLGSSKSAKKVALANILIKLFGVVCFGICYRWAYYPLVNLLNNALGWNNNPMIIALAHLSFNIINSFVIVLFLIKPLTMICNKAFGNEEEGTIEEQLLDYSLIKKSPSLAMEFVKKSIAYMANCMNEYCHIARDFSFKKDDKLENRGAELERTINSLDKRIHDYLIKLTLSDFDTKTSKSLSDYLDDIKDIERVGDHCTNIIEFFNDRFEKGLYLSEDGIQDLSQMFDVLLTMVDNTAKAIAEDSKEYAKIASDCEDEIDKMEDIFHERHVHRVNSGVCSFNNTEHYVEILSNIERMGDHLENICESILNDEYCQYDEFNH